MLNECGENLVTTAMLDITGAVCVASSLTVIKVWNRERADRERGGEGKGRNQSLRALFLSAACS
jgi:hypothetical protein